MPRRGKRRDNSVSTADTEENLPRILTLRSSTRQKTVKNDVAEDSSRSESASQNAISASTSSQGQRSNRKRKRVDTENSTCSKASPTNEASSSVDNRSNRESPELGCSICLGTVEDRAFTDACYHTFCFECLVEWSRVRAVCPLCKKPFHSIIHSFRSYDDYELYQVPTSYMANYVNISSLNNSEPLNLSRIRRFFNSGNPTLPPVNDADRLLALRRRVYTHAEEMQLRGLWSSDGVVVSPASHVSPAMFDCYPVMLERVRPWVLRDVAIIIGTGDIQYVAGIVLDLLRRFPITSEDFYERLFPYLGLHTRRFLLELDSFARSPFDMTTYDARVVYSTGPNVEEPSHLRTEHVEDISSGDDSDIEIVTPAVVTSVEPALNSRVNTVADSVVPDLLHCLRTIQQSFLMSFSFMNHNSHHSELESPIPGPSGLGQAVVTDENDSMGSHAAGSVFNAEEQSNSPMVLSDADSDVVVVDVDKSARSPIHISSGEDDDAAERVRTHRRIKRRRRQERASAEQKSECEQSENLTLTAHCDVENDLPQGDKVPSCNELLASSHNSADQSVEFNAEKKVHVVENIENSDHTQNQSSSHSSSVKLDDHSLKLSLSKTYHQIDDGKVANTGRHAFHHAHQKRSRSANSVGNVPVVSLPGTDDVKPLTCKKHISGHKSSKQKAREVVAEKRSVEVGDNAEKLITGEQVGATDGNYDSTDAGNNENQSSADLPSEVKVPSIGESSIVCADFSINHLPVRSSAEEAVNSRELDADSQLDEGMPVPSTSEVCSLPAVSSSDFGSKNVHDLSFPTAEVTFDIAHQCLPMADENVPVVPLRDANACSDSYDVIQMHSSVQEQPENAVTVALHTDEVDSFEPETVTTSVLSSNCMVSSNDVACSATEPEEPYIISSTCSSAVIDTYLPALPSVSSPSDSYVKHEHSDYKSEPSCNSLSSSDSQIHIHVDESCKLENEGTDITEHQPMQNDASGSLSVVPQRSESASIAENSFNQDSQFEPDISHLCTDTVSSDNWSLRASCDAHSVAETDFDGNELIDFRLTEPTGSASSLFHDTDDSPASPHLVVNDSILSPVGIDSSDSDSEVEWLETAVSGRQRCISISSGGSSISYGLLDDVASVLSDTDSLEMLDDELHQSGASQGPSAESQDQTHSNQPPQVNSAPLPSDVALSVDTDQVEDVTNLEQTDVEHEAESYEDTIVAGDNISEPEIPLHISPAADSCGQDTDTDIEEHDSA